MTQLLVSVRSAMEAEAALRGGAGLIDVKEPVNGSLGRAGDSVIADVVRVVAGQRPISAAMGELVELNEWLTPPESSLRGLTPPAQYVKWGLAGSANSWPRTLHAAMRSMVEQLPSCRAVAVAYADWRRAGAPRPGEVRSFAVEHATGAFLIDTWQKDGSTLLDWLSLQEIEQLQERCRTAGMPVALAGSLGPAEIRRLLPLRPDWIAVRGAVCQGRQRSAMIDESKVRHLVELVSSSEQQRCPSEPLP
jgi:uncharacterized protein (UPF0264 family)